MVLLRTAVAQDAGMPMGRGSRANLGNIFGDLYQLH
jgi:hypothetical protein